MNSMVPCISGPRTLGLILAVVGLLVLEAASPAWSAAREELRPPEQSRYETLLRQAVAKNEAYWRQIAEADPTPATSCRRFAGYALILCETGQHMERVARLFNLLNQMHDDDEASPGFGNMRWYWRDPGVTDANAVEFCVHDALVIWTRHGQRLSAESRQEVRQFLQSSITGCLRHRVPTSYTNIAILNAGNLLLLGEQFDNEEAAAEGRRRLDALVVWTATFGIHEFCTPTYYGTDLNGLSLLTEAVKDRRAAAQARALTELVWTDIAANWFAAAERLGGAHSRSYDYVSGRGTLDWHLWIQGWLTSEAPGMAERIEPFGNSSTWRPPQSLHAMTVRQLPRLVRQSWGMAAAESRTHYVCQDISLSTSSATYGTQDVPMAIDLVGPRESARCYFIADGREDPYGKQRYESGLAGHRKALHLLPFWVAAQRSCDALGLALYRNRDLSGSQIVNLQSHFVLRRQNDGLWLDGKPIELKRGTPTEPARLPIPLGRPLVIRYGTSAVGMRYVWGQACDGQQATAALIDDGNTVGCLRLTVEHRAGSTVSSPSAEPGAALWVRIGSSLKDDAAFEDWRKQFESAPAVTVEIKAASMRLEAPGQDGPVAVEVRLAAAGASTTGLVPGPCRGVLEVDGREIGRGLLTAVEPLRSYPPGQGPLAVLKFEPGKPLGWEAESAIFLPGMRRIDVASASGKIGLMQPPSPRGPQGIALWSIEVEKPGTAYLWARVTAADAKSNSFRLSLQDAWGQTLREGVWEIEPTAAWKWQCLRLEGAKQATPLPLPAGLCRLQIRVREAGAQIDRLWLSSDPDQQPP